MNEKFTAATITAVLIPKKEHVDEISVPYVHTYLQAHKDDVLVPQMRGAANVSLSLDRIRNLRIPIPGNKTAQEEVVRQIIEKRRKIQEHSSRLSDLVDELNSEIFDFKKKF